MPPLRPAAITALVLLFALNVAAFQANADGGNRDEYQVKAAFLFNFTKFVDWPETAFKTPDQPITICVLGRNPFGSFLEDAVRGKRVGVRTLAIREISSGDLTKGCHVVFVSLSMRKRYGPLLEEIRGRCILSIGETEDFIASGGIIAFKLQNGHVQFAIDANAAQRSSLHISAQLLRLAGAFSN